jgi:hypothetical protein
MQQALRREWGGRNNSFPLGPAIRYCCEHILAAGVAEITVVIGTHGKEIAEALHGLSVNFVETHVFGLSAALHGAITLKNGPGGAEQLR